MQSELHRGLWEYRESGKIKITLSSVKEKNKKQKTKQSLSNKAPAQACLSLKSSACYLDPAIIEAENPHLTCTRVLDLRSILGSHLRILKNFRSWGGGNLPFEVENGPFAN